MPKIDEKRLADTMRKLDMSRAEVLAMWAEDEEVDRMDKTSEIDSDLTAEQKKVVKKMKNVGTKKPTVYKHDTREKKLDECKVEIVSATADFLRGIVENVEIANPQKEIAFVVNGEHYSFSLIRHRKAKK